MFTGRNLGLLLHCVYAGFVLMFSVYIFAYEVLDFILFFLLFIFR